MEVRLEAPPWATALLSDLHDWRRRPLPVAELAPFDLPDDAWFEFAWLDAGGEPRADPDAPRAGNPWWDYACVVRGPRFAVHPDVPEAARRSRGRLERLAVESVRLPPSRRVFLYSPRGADAPGPVVYFLDGKSFWHYGRTGPLTDDLTDAGDLPPAHYAFVQPESRGREYVFHEPFRDFFVEEAMPAVEARVAANGERVLCGASLGGLACSWLALERPDLFATVAAFSGAFLIAPDDDPVDPFAGGEWLLERFRAGAGGGLRWSLDWGRLEWLDEAHRRLDLALPAAGVEYRCTPRSMGHNWTTWRQGLPDALRWAIGNSTS